MRRSPAGRVRLRWKGGQGSGGWQQQAGSNKDAAQSDAAGLVKWFRSVALTWSDVIIMMLILVIIMILIIIIIMNYSDHMRGLVSTACLRCAGGAPSRWGAAPRQPHSFA